MATETYVRHILEHVSHVPGRTGRMTQCGRCVRHMDWGTKLQVVCEGLGKLYISWSTFERHAQARDSEEAQEVEI